MMFGLKALGGGAAVVAPRFAAAVGTTARPRAAAAAAAVAEPSLRWFSSTPVALAKKKQAQANDGPGSQIAKAKILRRRRLLRKREHRHEKNQDVNTELLAFLEEFGPASKKDIYAKLDEDGGKLRAKLGSNNRVKGLLNDLRVFKLVSVERVRGKALSRFKIYEEGDVEEPTSDARYGDRVN